MRSPALRAALGQTRIVMRGPMFPSIVRFADGSIMVGAASVEEHSDVISIRSEDGGHSWRPFRPSLPTGAAHTLTQRRDGVALAMSVYTKPIAGASGWYQTTRWESADHWRTVRGPLEDGRLWLPPEVYDASYTAQWFHGNIIAMPDDSLLAPMQAWDAQRRFSVYLSRSDDGGLTWRFLAKIAALDDIADPAGATRQGWSLWGPCEPNIAHTGGGHLVCVMRLVNDDATRPLAAPTETYHDLNDTIAGDDIYQSGLPADRYYTLGPRSVPLVIAFSSDGGHTWSRATPMAEAVGCQPRLAQSDGILALTYGALAFPRWGNCVTFSADGGQTWSAAINFGPCLTTGYTGIVATRRRQFLCAFDNTPPQPWRNHAAHWVGVVDVTVGG